MDNQITIGSIIKRYIKMRGHSIAEIAYKVNVNYKTFSGLLTRSKIDADLLFELANILDIDLVWMSQLFGKHQQISSLERYQMSRMSSELRNQEIDVVLNCLDRHIKETLGSITDVKKALLRDFNQLFYLLDVLLPEDYIIRITVERGKEKYYCLPLNTPQKQNIMSSRSAVTTGFYEGNEMLKLIILERKEKVLL